MPRDPLTAAALLASGWETFREWLQRIWHFELFKVGDEHVVANQLVFGAITLVVGLWASRRVTRWVGNRLRRRGRLDTGVTVAVERILLYVMVVTVVLVSLQVVSIPLTVFAFMGGALAIGLGFGAQHIFNNFISGLILMLERHVRPGDVVELEGGSRGEVKEILYRCTRIRRVDGIEVLVPNSKLLEQNVINWTLADRRVRSGVVVGIAYGSDTEMAAKLMLRAAEEHGQVLKDPKPTVRFQEFGNSSLVFELLFWVELITGHNLPQIRSDLRFRMDKLLREANITIAYPQRDMHLDTQRPLEIRVLGAGQASASEATPAQRKRAEAEKEAAAARDHVPNLPRDVPPAGEG